MLSRSIRNWILGKFPRLSREALDACARLGHVMVHDIRWRHRRRNLAERWYCRYCNMSLYVEREPSTGFDPVHGLAHVIQCTYDPDKEPIIQGADYD